MSFFTSGSVDTSSIDRSKLTVPGVYRVRLTDFADHLGAFKGSRTQVNFTVIAGPSSVGSSKGHIVAHSYDAPWKADRARGEIATLLGAFLGFTRESSGHKVSRDVFLANTRTVNYAQGGKDVANSSRESNELPLVAAGAEAFLVVEMYLKNGQQKFNKYGEPSVLYHFLPLSANLPVTEASNVAGASQDAPPAIEGEDDGPDAMTLIEADGWKQNGTSAWYYRKGADGKAEQVKLVDLVTRYGG